MNQNIRSTSKTVVYTGLFLALGILLPQMFHFLPVPDVGKVRLPMHIPAILAGYLLGSRSGMIVGFLSPVISCMLFQMPPVLTMPIMAVEIMCYGAAAGIVGKKIKSVYLGLIVTMICGRIASGLMYVIMINLLGIAGLNMQMFFLSISAGVPGMILQLVLIPPMVKLLRKVNGEY